MKRLKIIFTMIALCYCVGASAQYNDLDKLPKQKRDSILTLIAKNFLIKYTEGYYREGAIPVIEDKGIFVQDDRLEMSYKYNGTRMYDVSYPTTKREKEFFRQDYLVTMTISAKTGVVYMVFFIDGFGFGEPFLWKSKRKFRTVDEVMAMGKKMCKVMPKEYMYNEEDFINELSPKDYQEYIKIKARRDSIANANEEKRKASLKNDQEQLRRDSLNGVKKATSVVRRNWRRNN